MKTPSVAAILRRVRWLSVPVLDTKVRIRVVLVKVVIFFTVLTVPLHRHQSRRVLAKGTSPVSAVLGQPLGLLLLISLSENVTAMGFPGLDSLTIVVTAGKLDVVGAVVTLPNGDVEVLILAINQLQKPKDSIGVGVSLTARVEFHKNGRAVAVTDRQSNALAVVLAANVEGHAVGFTRGRTLADAGGGSSSTESKLDMDVGQLERDNTNERVVLSVARVTDTDSDNSRTPVTNELFRSCVEDGLRRNDLCSSLVDEVVVEKDSAVRTGESLGLLLLYFAGLRAGWFVLTTLSLSIGALDIGQFQADNLMDNNAQNTRRPQRIGRSVDNGVFLCVIDSALVLLKLRLVCEFLGKTEIPTIRSKSLTELCLAKEAHFPVKLSRHFTLSLDTSEFGNLREHFARVLNELLDTELNLANDIIGR
ncbi:hypothetical protein HG531_000268 [Fusarium graminearum]|nr:hypothetical protein HG531_000268 [Fusarium graminearum]